MKNKSNVTCTGRSQRIQPFYVMELLEKAQQMEAQGIDIIHMEIGEPDFQTPELVKKAGIQAISEGQTFYTHSLGLPELRERIARYYLELKQVSVSPDRIIVTNGTSGAFFLVASVLLDRNRTLLISDPGYPCYKNFAILLGAPVVTLPVSGDFRYRLFPHQISEAPGKKPLLVLCSPSNPTGTIYDLTSLRKLHEAISARNGTLLVDEIYSGLTYGRNLPSALSLNEDVIVIDGFSKTFAMTGWRLGWVVVPNKLVRPIQKVAQNIFISAPTIAQHAALKAFDATADVSEMLKIYEERRNFLYTRLRDLGFELPVFPEGAFYIYTNIKKWGIDSMVFVERALLEAHVAVTPGYDFGTNLAGEHVRFSYANSMQKLEEGCRRLDLWLKSLN
jgi:aspartate/methionine/tyrosine aminotransferase